MTACDEVVAVVTGAASGIGRAVAARLVERGVHVVGLDCSPVDMPGVDARVVDLAVAGSVAAALEDQAVVHRLVSCAGVTGAAGAETTLLVNVLGLREVTDLVLERMPDDGAIAYVASVGGWRWERNFDLVRSFLEHADRNSLAEWCATHADLLTPSAYPFSKQCVVVETLLRAAELAPRRIRVNAVCPGLVDTPMLRGPAVSGASSVLDFPLPFGRMTTAEEQAAMLTYLVGPDSGALSGAIVPTDQGLLAAIRVGAIASPFGDA